MITENFTYLSGVLKRSNLDIFNLKSICLEKETISEEGRWSLHMPNYTLKITGEALVLIRECSEIQSYDLYLNEKEETRHFKIKGSPRYSKPTILNIRLENITVVI